jgi:hypothetical protein
MVSRMAPGSAWARVLVWGMEEDMKEDGLELLFDVWRSMFVRAGT